MSDDYENVEWNVHATADAYTPLAESDDPLSVFSSTVNHKDFANQSFASTNGHSTPQSPKAATVPYVNTNDSTESLDTSPSPPLPPPSSVNAQQQQPPLSSIEYTANPMTIRISDPQKHTDSQGAYISYLITTTTSVESFSSRQPRPVRRRYQDFVWLHNALTLEFPASIVPPLPEKHRLEYIKGDRFGPEFVERRRVSLQWFLDRIARHPELQQSACCRVFLESTDFRNDKRMQSRRVPQAASVLESLSDTLLNAFAKVKKPDERFVDMKENIDRLQDNLDIIERLYSRIGKRQSDLHQDYVSFAASIQGLSGLETGVAQPLHQFAETTKAYADAMHEMIHQEDLMFLNDVHELLAYCHAAKAVLRARDQKQVDFEELSAYLHRTIQEKERLRHPGRNIGGGGGLNISEFVTDRLNEVRGVDMQRARLEKIARLERRVKELESEVSQANDASNAFSNQVLKEHQIFEKAKTEELKQGLAAYADSHINFFQKGITVWESILPVLENIRVEDTEDEDVLAEEE